MTHTEKLRNFVAGWETLALEAYEDSAGVPTIGYGHTRDVQLGDVCTQEEADAWLDQELTETAEALDPYFTRDPSQEQFDAFVSLAYNCGADSIGKSGLMVRFNDGQDTECLKRWLMWNRAGGRILRGLTRRRMAEIQIYVAGNYDGQP